MSDPVSALGGAGFEGSVAIEERARGMVTVRGDLSSSEFAKAVSDVAGVEMPGQTGAVFNGERGIAWMSPDELLIFLPHGDAPGAVAALNSALAGAQALAVDVSDARAVFRLEGDSAAIREVLAKLSPADMRAAACPVGRFRRTRLAQVPAAVFFLEDGVAEVICFRSVAQYMFDLLRRSAMPGGEVGYFG